MKGFLNRLSNADKVTIMLKILAVGALALLMSSCASLDFRIATLNYAAQRQSLNVSSPIEVKTFTSNFDTFKNLDPQDLGLSFGGNWIHCRTHGFHDLNNWSDFTYNPYWCRPSDGFMRASLYNWNWGGYNYWNNQIWGYNNWMGNVYYGNGWNNYYGWNNTYVPYNWRRSNINGRRGNVSPRVRSTRTNTPTGVIRTRPTRTQTLPNNIRPTRTPIPNNVRTIRTPIRRSDVRPPMRTVTPPINNVPNNIRPVRTNNRTTTQPRRSKPTNVKKDNLK